MTSLMTLFIALISQFFMYDSICALTDNRNVEAVASSVTDLNGYKIKTINTTIVYQLENSLTTCCSIVALHYIHTIS